MKKYLAPLWVFITLNVLLLVAFLFMPAIGTAGEELAEATAETGAFAWGWTWVVGSVKLIVFLVFELLILFITAKAFLAVRER